MELIQFNQHFDTQTPTMTSLSSNIVTQNTLREEAPSEVLETFNTFLCIIRTRYTNAFAKRAFWDKKWSFIFEESYL